MNRHICVIQCIIPPHMLDQIEQNGTEAQKEVARNAQAASREISGIRHRLRSPGGSDRDSAVAGA